MEQFGLFDNQNNAEISIEDVFTAYYDCRKNKRGTFNALTFEGDYESRLVQLWKEINNKSYYPGRSIAFIVSKPVQREVFAADFRDRIVHHLIISKLEEHFESQFIEDSYSCRTGKGTQYGIKRIAQFIRECSENYTKDCYILKMDIQSFFMSMDKKVLFKRLEPFIHAKYQGEDKNLLIDLVEKVVFNNPESNCFIKGNRKDWKGLPPSKSLFSVPKCKGLPIGNLTSQMFANFYLDAFDHFVKDDCRIKYYGRYVDDFVIVHESKEFLLKIKEILKQFMLSDLKLTLHPRKVYLQHYTKGVKFIGAVVKPGREYIGNRTKGNLYEKLAEYNKLAETIKGYAKKNVDSFVSSVNSYLGFMIHYKTFKLRRKMLTENISPVWLKYISISPNMDKISIKSKYKPNEVMVDKVKKRRRNHRKRYLQPIELPEIFC